MDFRMVSVSVLFAILLFAFLLLGGFQAVFRPRGDGGYGPTNDYDEERRYNTVCARARLGRRAGLGPYGRPPGHGRHALGA